MREVQLLAWKDDLEAALTGTLVVGKALLHEGIPMPEGRSDRWATGLVVVTHQGERLVVSYDKVNDRLIAESLGGLSVVQEIPGRPTNT